MASGMGQWVTDGADGAKSAVVGQRRIYLCTGDTVHVTAFARRTSNGTGSALSPAEGFLYRCTRPITFGDFAVNHPIASLVINN